MGIKKNADASYNLGLGVSDANDYKGFAGQNEITIQLTADGATDKSMDALNYLKTFAINQAAAGLPIKPSASVSISANGYTKALEADDFEITETGVKIGGIEYTASTDSWDFTNALVPSGGGGGGGSDAFEVNFTVEYDQQTESYTATSDKTYSEISTAFTANKNIYAWMKSTNNPTVLTTAYINAASTFIFYFDDKSDPGLHARYQITVASDTITAFVHWEVEPVYIGGDYSSGDSLDETTLSVYGGALYANNAPVYININVANAGMGTFIFGSNYGGYCFAGPPEAIGATATIDDDTGEITVTPPNS
jgi:hypothetical protein